MRTCVVPLLELGIDDPVPPAIAQLGFVLQAAAVTGVVKIEAAVSISPRSGQPLARNDRVE